ncbi:Maf family protein [Ornithinibacillus contaminans]|uniref:Maf family protein n=1 Tax=Ornithinibacillus contaminans TaxID=694055 RepID=UPI00064E00E2|nr:Maf family protein [Ornithinibacillus contaminans]
MTQELILASTSPRRKELLEQVNIPFSIRKQDVDESHIHLGNPAKTVEQLAILKGKQTEITRPNEVILSADTVVAFNGNIFGKPKNDEDAFTMLTSLGGNVHEVYTGVMIRSHQHEISFVEKTLVEFWPLTEQEITQYIQSKEPFDKAGAYGIQGKGAALVKSLTGDYYTVMGLPISRVIRELKQFDIYPAS